MRNMIAILAMGLALAGCDDKKSEQQAQEPKSVTQQAQATQPQQAGEPTVEQLKAEAAHSEAEAQRLEAEATGQSQAPAGNAPGAANATAGTPMALAAGDEKLQTGQYYDTIGLDAQAGP